MIDQITARRIRVRTADLLAIAERLTRSDNRTIRNEGLELRELSKELDEIAADLEPGLAQKQAR